MWLLIENGYYSICVEGMKIYAFPRMHKSTIIILLILSVCARLRVTSVSVSVVGVHVCMHSTC